MTKHIRKHLEVLGLSVVLHVFIRTIFINDLQVVHWEVCNNQQLHF